MIGGEIEIGYINQLVILERVRFSYLIMYLIIFGNKFNLIYMEVIMVYFINLPFDGQDERTIQSLGAAYLAAELISQNIDVCIFDSCGVDREKNKEELYRELLHNKPDYIGFYVIEHNYEVTMEFINRLSKKLSAIFFLGGPQVNFLADSIMEREKNVDFILVGESEGRISKVINGDYTVNGLLYRKEGKVIKNCMNCENLDLDSLLFPVRELHGKCLLTQEIYRGTQYYVAPVSSSRGCPYNCSFCSVPALVRSQEVRWRFRSAENIEREIQRIHQDYGAVYIRFIDDNFLADIDRAISICKRIKEIGNIPFSFAGRVNSILELTDGQMRLLKECGVTAIEVGVENFNDHVLKRYRKYNTVSQTKSALRKLFEYEIYPGIDFIMFDPWTTMQDLENNYQIIVEMGLDSYSPPFLTNRLYPFPGCEYYNNGAIDMEHYFVREDVNKVYVNMMQFMRKYKKYQLFLQSGNVKNYVIQIYRRLPYKIFGYLLRKPDASLDDIEMIKRFEDILVVYQG